MKTIVAFLILFLGLLSYSFATSQIILINAEPYLVDLSDDYNVEKVYHKVPNYFSSPETHEEILAHFVKELNRESKLTSIEEETAKELVETDTKNRVDSYKAPCKAECMLSVMGYHSDLYNSIGNNSYVQNPLITAAFPIHGVVLNQLTWGNNYYGHHGRIISYRRNSFYG